MSMSIPSHQQLGAFVAEYQANRFDQLVNLIIAAISLYLVITDLNLQVGDTIYVLGPILRIFVFLLGLSCAYGVYERVGASVRLYEEGFVYHTNPKTQIVRWTDVQKVSTKVTRETILYFIPLPGTTNHQMTITLKNRRRVEIDSAAISHADTLAAHVVRSVRKVTGTSSTQAQ